MAGLVYMNRGGLVLAEHGADEAAVRAALKRLDPDLRLIRDDTQGRLYKVYKYMGSERDASWICDWREDEIGPPLPLTMSLVDKVASLAVGSRAPVRDELAENDALIERHARERTEMLEDLARDGARRARTAPCFKPGQYLRISRDKQRRRGLNL